MTAPLRDACPYHKPFFDGFDECVAYQPAQFVPLNMQYRPLPSVWTCSHLDLRVHPAGSHRYYARCRLGDNDGRVRWAERVRGDRMARLRVLQTEIGPPLRALTEELWSIKGRQLHALRSTGDASAETDELRAASARYMRALEGFLEEREDLLAGVSLPYESTMKLFQMIFDAWIEQPNAETPVITDEMLALFPDDARILLRPDAS